jgi:hypothetical protein
MRIRRIRRQTRPHRSRRRKANPKGSPPDETE